MPEDLAILSVGSVLAVVARAAGFAAISPMLGVGDGSMFARVVLAALLALILLPTANAPELGSGSSLPVLLLVELASGLLGGLALRVVLTGVTLSARLVEQQLGLTVAIESDEEVSGTPVGRLYQLTALAIFFCLGGHRMVVLGLFDSGAATALPTQGVSAILGSVTGLFANAWWLGVRVAGPLVLAMLAANLAVGMVARVLPQFGLPSVLLPVQVALGVVLILLSLAAVNSTLGQECLSVLRWLPEADTARGRP